MPVMMLDVPIPAWNQVVVQSVLYGLDMCPDNHRENGNTVVEITGTWDKLNKALARMKLRGPEIPELLAVMESKVITQCT